jgi:hypothetical protein
VLTNGIILVVQTSLMSSPEDNAESIYMPWVTYFFVACKSKSTDTIHYCRFDFPPKEWKKVEFP